MFIPDKNIWGSATGVWSFVARLLNKIENHILV
jgi:hypothetical protein